LTSTQGPPLGSFYPSPPRFRATPLKVKSIGVFLFFFYIFAFGGISLWWPRPVSFLHSPKKTIFHSQRLTYSNSSPLLLWIALPPQYSRNPSRVSQQSFSQLSLSFFSILTGFRRTSSIARSLRSLHVMYCSPPLPLDSTAFSGRPLAPCASKVLKALSLYFFPHFVGVSFRTSPTGSPGPPREIVPYFVFRQASSFSPGQNPPLPTARLAHGAGSA